MKWRKWSQTVPLPHQLFAAASKRHFHRHLDRPTVFLLQFPSDILSHKTPNLNRKCNKLLPHMADAVACGGSSRSGPVDRTIVQHLWIERSFSICGDRYRGAAPDLQNAVKFRQPSRVV